MAEEEQVAVHAYFSGIVQGVYFRANTQRRAESLGLRGWVRNLPDGRVEAWIEGGRPEVGDLIDFCQGGIPAATVDMVDMEESEPTGDYTTFEIVR
jgi:acylphosphatase